MKKLFAPLALAALLFPAISLAQILPPPTLPGPSVWVSSIVPTSGMVGTKVTITGSNFSATGNKVMIATAAGVSEETGVAAGNGKTLTVTITSSTNGASLLGLATVSVWNSKYGTSNSNVEFKFTKKAPVPTVSVSIVPATITLGQSAKVAWSTLNANSCVGYGAWSGAKALNGILTVTPTAAKINIAYTLECSGPGGTSQSGNTFTVTPATNPVVVAQSLSVDQLASIAQLLQADLTELTRLLKLL